MGWVPRSLLAFLLFAVIDHVASAARPTTHADIWQIRRLGTPELSPDGAFAVFSVSEPAYEEDKTISDLWLVEIDGSSPARRLTSTPSPESDPAWSPDGRRLAFATQRDDDAVDQIYILDMTGPGEAQRITTVVTGAASPIWSPDGTRIAFESHVYPGASDDAANRERKEQQEARDYNVSVYDDFPVRFWDSWRNDRQIHLFVQEAVAGAIARDLLAGTDLVEERGYAGFPTQSSDELQAAWTPDGEALIFVATTNLDAAAFDFPQYMLYRIRTEGGEPERLTSGSTSYFNPQFPPDGRSLYALSEVRDAYAYHLERLVQFSWPRVGEPRNVSPSFDRSPSSFTITRGNDLFVLANDAGRVRLFRQASGEREPRLLDEESRGVYAGLAAPTSTAADHLVARWEGSDHPAEIVRIDSETGKHTALTSFNTQRAAELGWEPFRELWFTSSKGRRIHSWLALPPDFDESRQYPLVLMIHGGPHTSSLDSDHVRWSPHLLAAPGYVVLMPDYTGSVGYGEAFAQAIQGDPLRTPGDELLEAVDAAIEAFPFIDATRLAATGASYGGHLVNWLQATTDRFLCLVGHAGLIDLKGQWATSDRVYHRELNAGGPPWENGPVWAEQSPATYAERFATPQLLSVGEKDFRVPINQTLGTWTYLKRRQVPSRLLVFHDANHWIMKGPDARFFWQETHAWLARYLAPDSRDGRVTQR